MCWLLEDLLGASKLQVPASERISYPVQLCSKLPQVQEELEVHADLPSEDLAENGQDTATIPGDPLPSLAEAPKEDMGTKTPPGAVPSRTDLQAGPRVKVIDVTTGTRTLIEIGIRSLGKAPAFSKPTQCKVHPRTFPSARQISTCRQDGMPARRGETDSETSPRQKNSWAPTPPWLKSRDGGTCDVCEKCCYF